MVEHASASESAMQRKARKYTPGEVVACLFTWREDAKRICLRWSPSESHADTMLITVEMTFLRRFKMYYADREHTNLKSFYLKAVAFICRDEKKTNVSSEWRSWKERIQQEKRALRQQEDEGKITFAERKRREQQLDDAYTEAFFYATKSYHRFQYVNFITSSDEEDDPTHQIELPQPKFQPKFFTSGDPIMNRLTAIEEWTHIWAQLTERERNLLYLTYVKKKDAQYLTTQFGTSYNVALSKIKAKAREIFEQSKASSAAAYRRASEDTRLQQLLERLGFVWNNFFFLS
jgi:hypothetical protein